MSETLVPPVELLSLEQKPTSRPLKIALRLTFHDVDQGADVTLLDDAAVLAVLHRIHAVHDLLDLRLLQVLHEVIVLDGLLDEVLGPGGRVKQN